MSAGTVISATDGSGRLLEVGGDLFEAETVPVHETHDLLINFRKGCECCREVEVASVLGVIDGSTVGREVVSERVRESESAAVPAYVLSISEPSNSEEPHARFGGIFWQRVDPSPHDEERLSDKVGCVLGLGNAPLEVSEKRGGFLLDAPAHPVVYARPNLQLLPRVMVQPRPDHWLSASPGRQLMVQPSKLGGSAAAMSGPRNLARNGSPGRTSCTRS